MQLSLGTQLYILPVRIEAKGSSLSRLPVIVGFGGINPAGRSSSHHAYRRLVIESLGTEHADETYAALAALMGLAADQVSAAGQRQYIRRHTLIRSLETNLFDPCAIPINSAARLGSEDAPVSFTLEKRHLPNRIPDNWQIRELDGGTSPGRRVSVSVAGNLRVLFPDERTSLVNAAGQLPTGFNLGSTIPVAQPSAGIANDYFSELQTL